MKRVASRALAAWKGNGGLLYKGSRRVKARVALPTGADQPRLAVGAITCLVKVNQTSSERPSSKVGRSVGISIIDTRYSGQPEE